MACKMVLTMLEASCKGLSICLDSSSIRSDLVIVFERKGRSFDCGTVIRIRWKDCFIHNLYQRINISTVQSCPVRKMHVEIIVENQSCGAFYS